MTEVVISTVAATSLRLKERMQSRNRPWTMRKRSEKYGPKLNCLFMSGLDSKTTKSVIRWLFRLYRTEKVGLVSVLKRVQGMTGMTRMRMVAKSRIRMNPSSTNNFHLQMY
jgi:hypothetical protein